MKHYIQILHLDYMTIAQEENGDITMFCGYNLDIYTKLAIA